ncbi:MAG: hypothetical protein MMC33_005086 [Icmadophila ericetorum]|nr:hypothetical protein [Icmadophila ericetorum]
MSSSSPANTYLPFGSQLPTCPTTSADIPTDEREYSLERIITERLEHGKGKGKGKERQYECEEGEPSSSTSREISPKTSTSLEQVFDQAWAESVRSASHSPITTPSQQSLGSQRVTIISSDTESGEDSSDSRVAKSAKSFSRKRPRQEAKKNAHFTPRGQEHYISLLSHFPEVYRHYPAGPIAGFPWADTANSDTKGKSNVLEAKTAKLGTDIALPDESTAVKHDYTICMKDYKPRNMIISNSPEIVCLPAGPTNRDTIGPAFNLSKGKGKGKRVAMLDDEFDSVQPKRGKDPCQPDVPKDLGSGCTTYKLAPRESYINNNMLLGHFPEMVEKPRGPIGVAFVPAPILGSRTVNILGMALPEDASAKKRRGEMATAGRFAGMGNIDIPPEASCHAEPSPRTSFDADQAEVLELRTASVVSLAHGASIITLERRLGSASGPASRRESATGSEHSWDRRSMGTFERITQEILEVLELPEAEVEEEIQEEVEEAFEDDATADFGEVPELTRSNETVESGSLSWTPGDDVVFRVSHGTPWRGGNLAVAS